MLEARRVKPQNYRALRNSHAQSGCGQVRNELIGVRAVSVRRGYAARCAERLRLSESPPGLLEAMPLNRGVASPRLRKDCFGKAKPYRTSDGKAAECVPDHRVTAFCGNFKFQCPR